MASLSPSLFSCATMSITSSHYINQPAGGDGNNKEHPVMLATSPKQWRSQYTEYAPSHHPAFIIPFFHTVMIVINNNHHHISTQATPDLILSQHLNKLHPTLNNTYTIFFFCCPILSPCFLHPSPYPSSLCSLLFSYTQSWIFCCGDNHVTHSCFIACVSSILIFPNRYATNTLLFFISLCFLSPIHRLTSLCSYHHFFVLISPYTASYREPACLGNYHHTFLFFTTLLCFSSPKYIPASLCNYYQSRPAINNLPTASQTSNRLSLLSPLCAIPNPSPSPPILTIHCRSAAYFQKAKLAELQEQRICLVWFDSSRRYSLP